MPNSTEQAKVPFSSATIVDNYDLSFDSGDPKNGSLYLGVLRGSATPGAAMAALRSAALWSDAAPKQVADDQREAYKSGLQFVAAVAYEGPGGELLLARFDHPKFPSDGERWAAWLKVFDASHARQA